MTIFTYNIGINTSTYVHYSMKGCDDLKEVLLFVVLGGVALTILSFGILMHQYEKERRF